MATAPSDNTSRSTTLPRKGRSKAHNRAVIRNRGGVFCFRAAIAQPDRPGAAVARRLPPRRASRGSPGGSVH